MDASGMTVKAADSGNRDRPRDSMFLQAVLRPDGDGEPASALTVRVRNISAGGLMAESEAAVTVKERILVELRNVGRVHGTIVWVNGQRFGIAFDTPIDPKLARQKATRTAPEPIMSRTGFRRISHPLG